MRTAAWFSLALAFSLTGCGDSDQQDLRSWMATQRRQVKPGVVPIDPPVAFVAQDYTGGNELEPFNIQKLLQAIIKTPGPQGTDDLIRVELARRKDVLEAVPLDAMAMVGQLNRNGAQMALVLTGKLLYQIKLGDHLGLNYGRVTKITESEMTLREVVQDASGEWITRPATLQLQEKPPEKTK